MLIVTTVTTIWKPGFIAYYTNRIVTYYREKDYLSD
jgi:hypothetical protein